MKLIYYGFGGFIGFVCGLVINLIFYLVEKSGHPILSKLVENHGAAGSFLIELYNFLPFFGIALGIIMVRMMFNREWEKKNEGAD